jgi:hypothetical protein
MPASAGAPAWATSARSATLGCVAAFALLGGLCGGLALAAWVAQGPVAVLGLGTAAAAFLSAAQITAGAALRA